MKLILSFFLLVLLTGCFRRPDPFIPFGKELSKEEIQDVVSLTFGNNIENYRALFSCELQYGRRSINFRQAVVADNKKRVRLETFPEEALYSVALYQNNSEKAVLLQQDKKEAKLLSQNSLSLNEDLVLQARPQDVMPLFAHTLYVSQYALVKGFQEGEKITIVEGDGRKEWQITNKTLTQFISRDSSQKKELIFSNLSSEYEDNFLLPEKIEIELPEKSYVLLCNRGRTEVNIDLKDSLFEPSIPSSWSIIDMRK